MEIISRYFPELTPAQEDQFSRLAPLYRDWNEKINVISRKDVGHLYEKHVLHSLGIAKIISFTNGSRVLDVGTGGGFPGIPLAILFPGTHFHLVDSIGKKIRVVESVVGNLGLLNVTAEKIRAEELSGTFDFIISRAVTDLSTFTGWVSKRINPVGRNELPNGFLYLKGGEIADEISSIRKKYRIYKLSDYFAEPYFETKLVVHIFS